MLYPAVHSIYTPGKLVTSDTDTDITVSKDQHGLVSAGSHERCYVIA